MLLAALCLLPSVCVFLARGLKFSEMFCLGAVAHSGCLRGRRLKALIVRGLS